MKATKIEQISERFYNQNQSWYYDRIVKAGNLRIKIEIRRGNCDELSHMIGFVLDGLKWERIVSKSIVGAECDSARYGNKNESIAAFRSDGLSVLGEMLMILTGL